MNVAASRRQIVAGVAPDADTDPKRLATLQARCALLGAELVQLKSGGFVLASGGFTRHLDSLGAVEHLLKQIGAR